MATAYLKNYRQSPRKVRLVADVVRGKKIKDAQVTLDFMPKRAALPIKKLLDSAIANAKINGENLDALVVKEISVQKGTVAHRWMPKWRGMAHAIKKRSSHVTIILGEGKPSKKEVYKAKKATEVEVKNEKPKATKTVTKKITKKSE
jgi:large subunit ribosomal protein L22